MTLTERPVPPRPNGALLVPGPRWQGRVTSRQLPEHDCAKDGLGPNERAEVVAIWLGRSAAERRAADSFRVIVTALGICGAPDPLVRLAIRAVDDEHRHAEICRLVASSYAGCELPAPARLPIRIPIHRGAKTRLRAALHVVGQCALNETTASVFLQVSLDAATTEIARAALRELLSDEIDHARIGWAFLAMLDTQTRTEVAQWLPQMLANNQGEWLGAQRETDLTDRPNLAGHGVLSRAAVDRAVHQALTEVIQPGFTNVGMSLAG